MDPGRLRCALLSRDVPAQRLPVLGVGGGGLTEVWALVTSLIGPQECPTHTLRVEG